jgi:hypothetical protein
MLYQSEPVIGGLEKPEPLRSCGRTIVKTRYARVTGVWPSLPMKHGLVVKKSIWRRFEC